MEKWYVAAKKADFDKWAAEFRISPVVARILRNRDLTQEGQVRAFLYGTLADCHSPWLLKDMDKAVEYLLEAVEAGTFIRVIGDYDVDGICSAYILTRGLQLLGAKVDTAIPHRIHDGYGLNDHLIQEAKEDGVGMILTCDNGIAAASQVALAHSLGIQVIVTDHHEVPFSMEETGKSQERETADDGKIPDGGAEPDDRKAPDGGVEPDDGKASDGGKHWDDGKAPDDGAEPDDRKTSDGGTGRTRRELLPPALAVIDPKQASCRYPFPGICGGTVAYKLVQALAEKTQDGSLQEAMSEFLEFAALATVCDVMELKDENRILVKEGLRRIGQTRNLGLRALMEVNGIQPGRLDVYHLGFVLGPCLNATGRLDTARRALELLQSTSLAEAMEAARELKDLNDSRKYMTSKGVEEAQVYLQEHRMTGDKVMLVFLPDVHESLAGIIAGRIREKYNHPVFVLTRGEDGVKGSGRSIEGYHMYEAMTEVGQYFTKFGGHAMAAGLSMREEDIEALRRELNARCTLREEDFVPRVHIDVPMPMEYGDGKLAEELELLQPFGVGNPKPLFAQKDLVLLAGTKMGVNKNFARFRVKTPGGNIRQLVYFGDLDAFGAFLEEKYGPGSQEALYDGRAHFPVAVAYQIGKNTYRGVTEVQYVMQHYS